MNRYYRRYASRDGLVHHSFVREDGEEWDGAARKWVRCYARETRCGIVVWGEWSPEKCDILSAPTPVTCFQCLTNTEPTFDELK